MASEESLIVAVIQAYEPLWDPPTDNGREWVSCLCPFHGDSRKSAAVSFQNDAFKCFVCDATGDAIGILMRREEMTYQQAIEYAETISPGCNAALPAKPKRKSGRRVFGESGSDDGDDREVSTGIRERSTPWS